MSIHVAINNIMNEVGAIAKTKTNTQQGFKFRGIDDVMNTLHPLMCKHKVFAVPEVLDQQREERQTRNGGNLIYSVCTVKYTFFADDGTSIYAVVVGEGMDSGDKATNKAMAIAFKYACFQVFCIPTEEMVDPDQETPEESLPKEPPKEPPKESSGETKYGKEGCITQPQAKRMFAISKGDADLCKSVIKSFGYDKTEDVKKTDYDDICNEIENAVEERQA